jgi:SM-20-related protein
MSTDYSLACEALSKNGYIVLPNFIDTDLTSQLYDHVTSLPETAFHSAKIGRQQSVQQLGTVRNDKTAWLSNIHSVEQAYLATMDGLKMQLNRQLFLGLRDFEAHFAHYPPGHFYQRHVDAFRGQSNRVVSSVFYLNPKWSEQDQGQLVLYKPDSDVPLQTVMPKMGTLVLFLSEQFPHEVLPALRDRYSIAGWFRTDSVLWD